MAQVLPFLRKSCQSPKRSKLTIGNEVVSKLIQIGLKQTITENKIPICQCGFALDSFVSRGCAFYGTSTFCPETPEFVVEIFVLSESVKCRFGKRRFSAELEKLERIFKMGCIVEKVNPKSLRHSAAVRE